jgi:hypothetical protein
MSTHDARSIVILGVDPVRVIEPVGAQSGHTTDPALWAWIAAAVIAVAMVVALGVVATAALSAYRRVRTLAPEEDAFRSVCKAMRIPPAEWATIRVLAERIDAAPVALLLSRTAFDRAVGPRSAAEPGAVAAVRSRAFGEDAPQ